MQTFTITSESLTVDANRPDKNEIWVYNNDSSTKFVAEPFILKQIVMYMGNAVWPNWITHKHNNKKYSGREIYLGYIDQCEDGVIVIADTLLSLQNFDSVKRINALNVWEVIKKHLDADGFKITVKQ